MTQTNGMIALVPTDADAQRLAMDGGEDASELHVTLMFLGDVTLLPQEVCDELVRCVGACVASVPVFPGKIFSVNLFNPGPGQGAVNAGPDVEPCVVWGVNGEFMENVRETVEETTERVFADAGLEPPTQHEPWVAHITAAYLTPDDSVDISAFTDRVGPVTFDRVRIAIGENVYDVPLGSESASEGDVGDVNEMDTEAPIESPQEDTSMPMPMTAGSDAASTWAAWAAEQDWNGELVVPNILFDWRGWVTAAKERDVNIPVGPGHQLRDYWVHGEGAAKIGWNTYGDFTRCVEELGKYVTRPQGLCAEYHTLATGKHPHRHPGRPTESGETTTFVDDAPHPSGEHVFVDGVCTTCADVQE